MSAWSDWQERRRIFSSAYVDWEVDMLDKLQRLDSMRILPASQMLGKFEELKSNIAEVQKSELGSDPRNYLLKIDHFFEQFDDTPPLPEALLDAFPVPEQIVNPDFEPFFSGKVDENWLSGRAGLPKITDHTVVVGVIDLDIGIGHRRFRDRNGKTRVLAAWQQGAAWQAQNSPYLPFGEELFESDINKALRKHSQGNDLTQPLNQEGFYQDLGLINYDRIDGMGTLAKRHSHGTHVTGLAAGVDPLGDDPNSFSENVKMLVVNLPPPPFYGEGGAFLDYYLSYGLLWIIETHKGIARANKTNPPPLYINVSFGKLAGAGDRRQTFVEALDDHSNLARVEADHKLTVIMPTGNDNLERCHALIGLEEEPQSIEWRIQPDDGTSNFLEIWTLEEFLKTQTEEMNGDHFPLLLDVVLPGSTPDGFSVPTHLSVRELGDGLGRIYCDWVKNSDTGKYRLRYLVCLAPDSLNLPGAKGAPAGKYEIHLQNGTRSKLRVRAQIQTDEATIPGVRNAKRSYFEAPEYRLFEWEGRRADAYLYAAGKENKTNIDGDSHIRRHGTMNAYAANSKVTTIAGFRLSDGRPAYYSGTGLGFSLGEKIAGKKKSGRGAPTAAFPSDDGYAHFGLLSDGAQDGSTVAMRGTSFACAAATRFAVEAALEAVLQGKKPADAWTQMKKNAQKTKKDAMTGKKNTGWVNLIVDIEKAGWGRVADLPSRGVKRM